LPYIFLYQTMTKGCYMPNIYAFIGYIYSNKYDSPSSKHVSYQVWLKLA